MQSAKTGHSVSQLLTVVGILIAVVAGFAFLWYKADNPMPDFVEEDMYRVTFHSSDVKHLTERESPVRMAGVEVGNVSDLANNDDQTRVTLGLSDEAVPLHDGVTVRIGLKGLVGSSYVEIVDGEGGRIQDGATLPKSAVKPAVGVDELISTFDDDTRDALSGTVQSLGAATEGTSEDIRELMTGLGKLGREGHTAIEAIAAQSEDLESLSRNSTALLNALDTGRGRIAEVVRHAERLTAATAGQRGKVEETMRALPTLLDTTHEATGKLGELSDSLTPVAADLRQAAPDLNEALLELPAVTSELRGSLPALQAALDAAPATLDRVPRFGQDVRALIPGVELMLRDVNPMLAYLEPYGQDLGSMFANFGASKDVMVNDAVRPVRLAPVVDSASVRGNPLPLPGIDPLNWNNPYPGPGAAGDPAPFEGDYPRVEREPQ
ncbi:phospholipid/cholesterol/gamma-HCH transport system substrate-binding protein [Haloechinothrix alba]|uniref:Phospholipid/cholesterol/gamma-HCH transport system substrate-binding protein n=1 Tax=Haloechinothrix alba TaxID=664784 RepID=A0A239AAE3_9PSEU|nr:MlaD family protein [Haloechinothrix alba]SNR92301.1 phospholipid/cholesterol/gamma-HCH transport system substrate-binding protein [Haloechinothrix alba]